MEPAPAAYASASLIAGWALGGLIVRAALAATRAVVKRTRSRRDDELLERVERWLADNPAAVEAVEAVVRRVRGG